MTDVRRALQAESSTAKPLCSSGCTVCSFEALFVWLFELFITAICFCSGLFIHVAHLYLPPMCTQKGKCFRMGLLSEVHLQTNHSLRDKRIPAFTSCLLLLITGYSSQRNYAQPFFYFSPGFVIIPDYTSLLICYTVYGQLYLQSSMLWDTRNINFCSQL